MAEHPRLAAAAIYPFKARVGKKRFGVSLPDSGAIKDRNMSMRPRVNSQTRVNMIRTERC